MVSPGAPSQSMSTADPGSPAFPRCPWRLPLPRKLHPMAWRSPDDLQDLVAHTALGNSQMKGAWTKGLDSH